MRTWNVTLLLLLLAPRKRNTDDDSKSKSPKTNGDSSGGNQISLKNSSSRDIGTDYDPTKSKYHPIEDAFWKRGEK